MGNEQMEERKELSSEDIQKNSLLMYRKGLTSHPSPNFYSKLTVNMDHRDQNSISIESHSVRKVTF